MAILYPHPNLTALQLEILCVRWRLRLKIVGWCRYRLVREG